MTTEKQTKEQTARR